MSEITEDALKIAEHVGFDIARFNRFIEAARMCGYELVRNGKALRGSSEINAELLDPEMPVQQLRLHMGELTASEVRVARAAIAWANTRALRERKAAARWFEEFVLHNDRTSNSQFHKWRAPIETIRKLLEG